MIQFRSSLPLVHDAVSYAVPQAFDLCGVIDVDGETVGVVGAGRQTLVDAVSVALYLAARRHRVVQAHEIVVTLCERSMIVYLSSFYAPIFV